MNSQTRALNRQHTVADVPRVQPSTEGWMELAAAMTCKGGDSAVEIAVGNGFEYSGFSITKSEKAERVGKTRVIGVANLLSGARWVAAISGIASVTDMQGAQPMMKVGREIVRHVTRVAAQHSSTRTGSKHSTQNSIPTLMAHLPIERCFRKPRQGRAFMRAWI